MFLCKVILTTLLGAVWVSGAAIDSEDGFYDPETDAIVIEAFSSAANAADQRGARQLYHPIQLLYPQRQPVQLTHPLFGGIQGIRTSSGQSPIRTGEQQNQEEILEIPPKEEVQEVQEEPKEEEKTEIFTTPCTMNDGRPGLCKSFKACYPYFKTFNFTEQESWVMGSYERCSYETKLGREIRGFCCSDESPRDIEEEDAVSGDPVEPQDPLFGEFPVEFSEVNNGDCGRRNFNNVIRIVNGQEASINEYPFMAAMLNRRKQFCGGSVITDKHILTAAHCVAHMSKYDVQNLRVVLGDHNLKLTGETRGEVFQHSVKRVIRHKKFDNVKLHNDVAILTLDKPITRSDTVSTICLAEDRGEDYVDEIVDVAGWGTTSSGASVSSDVLRKVDVKVWTNNACSSSYGSKAPGGITSGMICANKREGIIKDSCSGDSGGPLFKCTSRNAGCRQIGIVSWGIGCAKANYPGVYTRVSEVYDWIQRIVRKY